MCIGFDWDFDRYSDKEIKSRGERRVSDNNFHHERLEDEKMRVA